MVAQLTAREFDNFHENAAFSINRNFRDNLADALGEFCVMGFDTEGISLADAFMLSVTAGIPLDELCRPRHEN